MRIRLLKAQEQLATDDHQETQGDQLATVLDDLEAIQRMIREMIEVLRNE